MDFDLTFKTNSQMFRRTTDIRKRVVAVATLWSFLLLLVVSVSETITPIFLSGAVFVSYVVHLVGVLDDRQRLFHAGLYAACYAHGMQSMLYYAVDTWWSGTAFAAVALSYACLVYTAASVFTIDRDTKAAQTVQPAVCEDESKQDYV